MEIKEPAVDYFKRMTIEEYLAFENASDEKHEYYQGEVLTMSGAQATHNEIVVNTMIEIGSFLKGKPCKPYNGDQRIYVEKNSLFTYPDISIFCNGMHSRNNDEMNAVNPSVIIEVLSPGTMTYDRGRKFNLYQDIPTLKEYILIDSTNIHTEVFAITAEGIWEKREYKNIHDKLIIQTIGLAIPLEIIYEGTKLM